MSRIAAIRLAQHVVPMLSGETVTMAMAANMIREFVGGSKFDPPEFWAYFASYDWYWFCRVFGGMMNLPDFYPHLARDFAYFQHGIPNVSGPEHFARLIKAEHVGVSINSVSSAYFMPYPRISDLHLP